MGWFVVDCRKVVATDQPFLIYTHKWRKYYNIAYNVRMREEATKNLKNRGQETRPWGNFLRFTKDEISTVKILNIKAGQRFSLQEHEHRDEFWRVLSGTGFVTIGDEDIPAKVGSEFWITRHALHRARASRDIDLEILEIAFGDFDENDIKRVADDYGRT